MNHSAVKRGNGKEQKGLYPQTFVLLRAFAIVLSRPLLIFHTANLCRVLTLVSQPLSFTIPQSWHRNKKMLELSRSPGNSSLLKIASPSDRQC